jgi:Arc/MetJ-type ribon-helix-helix transcriptional regulator
MTITLNPQQEAIVRRAMEAGGFDDAGEVIERALALLESSDEEEDDWLAQEIEEIDKKLDRSLEQAARGEFLTPEQARQSLQRGKEEWLRTRSNEK